MHGIRKPTSSLSPAVISGATTRRKALGIALSAVIFALPGYVTADAPIQPNVRADERVLRVVQRALDGTWHLVQGHEVVIIEKATVLCVEEDRTRFDTMWPHLDEVTLTSGGLKINDFIPPNDFCPGIGNEKVDGVQPDGKLFSFFVRNLRIRVDDVLGKGSPAPIELRGRHNDGRSRVARLRGRAPNICIPPANCERIRKRKSDRRHLARP